MPEGPATPAGPPAPADVTRILVADDHPVTREGLALILDNQPDMAVVAQAADGREAVGLYATARPDVAVLDLQMPNLSGAAATELIVRADPAARVLLLTTYDGDEDIYRGMHAGAKAYLLKEASRAEILHAVRAVARGQRYLSPAAGAKLADRELEVLRLVAAGRANKEIAAELSVSEGTIKSHLNSITSKLGVSSRTEAALTAVRRGILRG